jgi:hypothetical protein
VAIKIVHTWSEIESIPPEYEDHFRKATQLHSTTKVEEET